MALRACFATLVVLLGGCAVDGVDNVFGRPVDEGGRSGEGGDGTGGSTSQNPTVTTSNPDATTDTTDSTTATTDVTATTDATATTTDMSTTTGPMPEGPTVFCAGLPCQAGQVCCYHATDVNQDHCASECENTDEWSTLACNGPDDCQGGQECCGDYNNQQGWGDVQCEPDCSDFQVELCFEDASACEGGPQSCLPSQGLGVGYSYCSGG